MRRPGDTAIGNSVADVDQRVGEVAASIDQILAASQKMQQNIGEVATVAEESSASTEEVSASSEELPDSAARWKERQFPPLVRCIHRLPANFPRQMRRS